MSKFTPSNVTSSIVLTRPLLRTLQIGVMSAAFAALATGCGGSLKPEVHKPTKLVKLQQAVDVVTPVMQTSVSNRSKLAEVNRFNVGFDEGQLVVAGSSGDVESYDLAGNKLWETNVDEAILGGVTFNATSQTAIVTTRSANVVAIDTTTGDIKWKTKLNGTVLSPALIHNDRVVVSANDGEIVGLSLQTGDKVWQFATQSPNVSIRGSAQPILLDVTTVLIASADGRLHALDVDGGIPIWSRRVGIPSGASEVQRMTDIDAAPVIDRNFMYAVSYSGQLIGVDLASRQVMFLKEAASKNRLALTGDAVIVTTLDGIIKAYDRQNGALLWESDELAYRDLSNPVVIGQYVAVGDLDGVIHFLSPTDGRIVSRTQTKGDVKVLQVKDGYLLTETQSGTVAVWRLAG